MAEPNVSIDLGGELGTAWALVPLWRAAVRSGLGEPADGRRVVALSAFPDWQRQRGRQFMVVAYALKDSAGASLFMVSEARYVTRVEQGVYLPDNYHPDRLDLFDYKPDSQQRTAALFESLLAAGRVLLAGPFHELRSDYVDRIEVGGVARMCLLIALVSLDMSAEALALHVAVNDRDTFQAFVEAAP